MYITGSLWDACFLPMCKNTALQQGYSVLNCYRRHLCKVKHPSQKHWIWRIFPPPALEHFFLIFHNSNGNLEIVFAGVLKHVCGTPLWLQTHSYKIGLCPYSRDLHSVGHDKLLTAVESALRKCL